jgi:hypothetical protein
MIEEIKFVEKALLMSELMEYDKQENCIYCGIALVFFQGVDDWNEIQ